jgi:hypothetical protein
MNVLHPGNGFLFMKVGTHASEDLSSILQRKNEEIARGGFAMWGYGGGTCHPLTMVRPFADMFQSAGEPIRLVMEEMTSNHFAEQVVAEEYSIDGKDWTAINTEIHKVLGSRYALFIKNLRKEEFELPLAQSKVAVGPSEGRRGNTYVQGRVDKACLVLDPLPTSAGEEESISRPISLVADIVYPYAALLRNKP